MDLINPHPNFHYTENAFILHQKEVKEVEDTETGLP